MGEKYDDEDKEVDMESPLKNSSVTKNNYTDSPASKLNNNSNRKNNSENNSEKTEEIIEKSSKWMGWLWGSNKKKEKNLEEKNDQTELHKAPLLELEKNINHNNMEDVVAVYKIIDNKKVWIYIFFV